MRVNNLAIVAKVGSSNGDATNGTLFYTVGTLSDDRKSSFRCGAHVIQRYVGARLGSGGKATLVGSTFRETVSSRFVRGVYARKTRRSSIVLSSRAKRYLFAVRSGRIIESFGSRDFCLPLICYGSFSHFVLWGGATPANIKTIWALVLVFYGL